MDDEVEAFIHQNEICYDRFTFDKIFRFLLKNEFDHENAKDLILHNCGLSALVLQERIDNQFYKSIKEEDKISKDLQKLKDEIWNDYLQRIGKLN